MKTLDLQDVAGLALDRGRLIAPLRGLSPRQTEDFLSRLRRELPRDSDDAELRRRVEVLVLTDLVRRLARDGRLEAAVAQFQAWHRQAPLLARRGPEREAVATQALQKLPGARLRRWGVALLRAAVERCEVPRDARYGLVLAGGLGSRFWPLGRHHVPKPCVRLFPEGTMLQLTLRRLLTSQGPPQLIIIANDRHLTFIARDLREDPFLAQARDRIHLVGEPVPGGTAAAILLGFAHALRHRASALGVAVDAPEAFDRLAGEIQLEVFTADHMTDDGFQEAMRRMAQRAWMGPYLSLQGYPPDQLNDQFGQQVLGERVVPALPDLANLQAFGEKDPQLARRWREQPVPILWNSGYLAVRGDTLLAVLQDLAGPAAATNRWLSDRVVTGQVVDHLGGLRKLQASLLRPDGPARRALLLEAYAGWARTSQAWDVAFAEPVAGGASARVGAVTTLMGYRWFDIGMPDQIAKYVEARPGGPAKDAAGNFSTGPILKASGGARDNVAIGWRGATVHCRGTRGLLVAVETDALLVQARGESAGVRALNLAGASRADYQSYFLSTVRYPLSNAARTHATIAGSPESAPTVRFTGPGMSVWTGPPGSTKPSVEAVAEVGFLGTVGLDARYGAGETLVIVREAEDVFLYGPAALARGRRHAERVRRRMARRDEAVASFRRQPRPVRLRGTLHHYAWGGRDFIRALVSSRARRRRPHAEYCFGGHPKGPSAAVLGPVEVALDRLAFEAAGKLLGGPVARRWDRRFPWVLKVLEARQMLSLQVHPQAARARQRFLEGNANYTDPYPKPEVHVALTEFWMLHGFRPLAEVARVLGRWPDLGGLMPDFAARLAAAGSRPERRRRLLRELFERVINLGPGQTAHRVQPLAAALRRAAAAGRLRKADHGYWFLRAVEAFGEEDPGILAIFLLNLVRLNPGEGTFQAAGTLHAYLEGTTVELMACSDNVVRAGLTHKPVDVGELLEVLDDAGGFRDGPPARLAGRARAPGERVYVAPDGAFELSRLALAPRRRAQRVLAPHSAEILLALSGRAQLAAASLPGPVRFRRGQSVLIPAGAGYQLSAAGTGGCVVFRARTPATRPGSRGQRS